MSVSVQQHGLTLVEGREHSQSLIEALSEALNVCKQALEELSAHQLHIQKQMYIDKLMVKSAGRLIIVHTDDIEWIEAWRDYVRLHCKTKIHVIRQKVSDVEVRLDPKQFLRIGRSVIVNVNRIKELEPLNHGEYIICLQDNTQLNLSRNYRDRLITLFGSHL